MQDEAKRRKRHHDAAVKKPELTILSDLPLDQEEAFADTFELDFRIGPIYDILRHPDTRTPMAIAIHGDWGAGKTSAMRWLDDKLAVWNKEGEGENRVRVKTVWFYPWKYHAKEDVWRGLISEVIIKSIDVEGATMATVTNAAKRFGGFLGRSFVQVLANITLKAKDPSGTAEAELSLSAIKEILDEYREAAHPEKAFLNEFEQTLKSWLDNSLGKNERMVIFIDDLDRCLPDVALEVLEALKLYLNIKNLLFVVGIDKGVVDQLVQQHYVKLGLAKEKSVKYLAKMFQVEVPVEPSDTQTAAYLSDQLAKIDLWNERLSDEEREIFTDIILGRAVRNPREVKRLINSALMFGAGALMGSENTDDEKKRMGFNQGLQVFFVREILDKVHHRADLLRQSVGLRFFSTWSEIVRANPDAPHTLPPESVKELNEIIHSDAASGAQEAAKWAHSHLTIPGQLETILAESAFAGLLFLLQDRDLGELMRIPYPSAEAVIARMTSPAQPDEIIRALVANMVRIPAGSFQMGSEESENEQPVHDVTLDAFEMSATPVTQAQYEAVMGDNPSGFTGADRPVECVSWYDAMKFCDELSKRTGMQFTLPSEAQWEYACRAGSVTRFCFGDEEEELKDYAWFGGISGGETHPVALKKPNAWRLYDMHGNVLEWCRDTWHDSYEGAPTDGSAWEEPGTSGPRVFRGGSWYLTPQYCRSAYRYYFTPDSRDNYLGFRVVRTV